MKIAIITGLAGSEEHSIQDPATNFSYPGTIDYYAFVDRPHSVQVWRQLPLPDFSIIDHTFKDRRNARMIKILGSFLVPGYDYYIWHDQYCDVAVNPVIIVKEFLKDNLFAVFAHPERNCVYQEIAEMQQRGLNGFRYYDHNENFELFKRFLEQEGFLKEQGLFETSSFVYKNHPSVTRFMLSWWELICKYSSRDQISFAYLMKKYQMPHSILPGSGQWYTYNNPLIPQVRFHR
jgi:hypothetical protein